MLIDFKAVEFCDYAKLPHLACPILTHLHEANKALAWACAKARSRMKALRAVGVRDLDAYNSLTQEDRLRISAVLNRSGEFAIPEHMPRICVIVDEFAELTMGWPRLFEQVVVQLSSMAREVGIHLICATQRPYVVTDAIKDSMAVRIALQVSSRVDSRAIIDGDGAELLLGKGDMLVLHPGESRPRRAQGAFVFQEEIMRLAEFVACQPLPEPQWELGDHLRGAGNLNTFVDELYEPAVQIVLETQRGSVSQLQRRLRVGYSRAARLVDMMAEEGIVGSYRSCRARGVLLSLEEWEQTRAHGGNA